MSFFFVKNKSKRGHKEDTCPSQKTLQHSKTMNWSFSWQFGIAHVELIYIIIDTKVKTTHMLSVTVDNWWTSVTVQLVYLVVIYIHFVKATQAIVHLLSWKRGPCSNVRLSRTRSYFPLQRQRHMRRSLYGKNDHIWGICKTRLRIKLAFKIKHHHLVSIWKNNKTNY